MGIRKDAETREPVKNLHLVRKSTSWTLWEHDGRYWIEWAELRGFVDPIKFGEVERLIP